MFQEMINFGIYNRSDLMGNVFIGFPLRSFVIYLSRDRKISQMDNTPRLISRLSQIDT